MYKTKDLTAEDLRAIEIKNQAEIVQYIGSELDLVEAHKLIEEESEGFTTPNANAEKADALLYAIYKGEAIANTSEELIPIWETVTKEEAIKQFKDGSKVYAIGQNEEKILVESEGVFSLADKFAMQVFKKKENKKQTLTKEQIRILKVKKETELALLTLKLKSKRKSA